MLTDPVTLEQLVGLLAESQSSAELLESVMAIEGDVSLRFGETHLASDTEFLSTYYSAYFLALLLQNESHEAHMLMRRIPPSLAKSDTILQNTLILVRAVWHKKHSMVYQTIRQSAWPDALKPLAQAFEAHFRDQTFSDLGNAYETIRLAAAASFLGFDMASAQHDAMDENAVGDNFIAELTAKGWKYDAQSKLLTPVAPGSDARGFQPEEIKIGQLTSLLGGYGD